MKKSVYYFLSSAIAVFMLTLGGCSKSSTSLPAIGGFNSSSDIEKASLVAYWNFNGNFNESVQGLTPTPSATAPTFVSGVKGQAYQGSGDTYVSYPVGTLTSLPSLTVSIWFKQSAQPINNTTPSYIAGQGPQGMLFMYNANNWNSLEIENEPYTPKSGDSLRMHAGFVGKVSTTGAYTPNEGVVPEGFYTNVLNKWSHLVMTYDASSSVYTLYQDGNVIGVGSAWSSAKTASPVTILTGPAPVADGGTQPFGALNMDTPLGLIIGGFPQVLNNTSNTFNPNTPQPWTGNWQGALDEIRIYKTALTAVEVGSLYQLELAGR